MRTWHIARANIRRSRSPRVYNRFFKEPSVRTYVGDIWRLVGEGYHAVIPVNIGWRSDGTNVMGKGLALQARYRYPECEAWLGRAQRNMASAIIDTGIENKGSPTLAHHWIFAYPDGPLIFMPTKPLNWDAPWISWKGFADAELVCFGLTALPELAQEKGIEKIVVPLVGAGLGGLDPGQVEKMIREILGKDSRFVFVIPKELALKGKTGWRN